MKVLERFEESINHVDQFNKVFDTLKSAAEHIDVLDDGRIVGLF